MYNAVYKLLNLSRSLLSAVFSCTKPSCGVVIKKKIISQDISLINDYKKQHSQYLFVYQLSKYIFV